MDDAMVVKICDGRERRAYEVCSIGFIVAAFTANAVEKFSSKG